MSGRLRLQQRAAGGALRAALALFRALPLDNASALGGRIARGLGPRLPVSRTARRNLARAFPELTPAGIEAVVRDMWDNLGRTAAEYAHLDHIDCFAPDGRVEVIGAEHFDALREAGKPAIFFAAHQANWELMSLAATQRGMPLDLVYRAANNPHVETIIQEARRGRGRHLKKGAAGARELVRSLKDGGCLGMLVDQKLNEGIPVPFFGRDAMTSTALAQMALKYACPIVPARVERLGGARFRITVLPPMRPQSTGDLAADIRRTMTEVNALLENWIRERPAEWLWLHKRWPT